MLFHIMVDMLAVIIAGAKENGQLKGLFGCKVGIYPFRYYIQPMHYRKLNNNDWKGVEKRIENGLCSWKGKLLSTGDN